MTLARKPEKPGFWKSPKELCCLRLLLFRFSFCFFLCLSCISWFENESHSIAIRAIHAEPRTPRPKTVAALTRRVERQRHHAHERRRLDGPFAERRFVLSHRHSSGGNNLAARAGCV